MRKVWKAWMIGGLVAISALGSSPGMAFASPAAQNGQSTMSQGQAGCTMPSAKTDAKKSGMQCMTMMQHPNTQPDKQEPAEQQAEQGTSTAQNDEGNHSAAMDHADHHSSNS